MTITEARKRCDELGEQMDAVDVKHGSTYDFTSRYNKEQEIKPLYKEWNKLAMAIKKTEDVINIEE